MKNLYLSGVSDLSQYRRMGDSPQSSIIIDTKDKSYNLAGKYSVKAKHATCLRLKACLLTLCSLGFALCSEKVREAAKGRKIRIIYTEEAVGSIKSDALSSPSEVPVVKYDLMSDPTESLKSFQNETVQFTKKVFEPISKPIRLNKKTINANELENLLIEHNVINKKEILSGFNMGESSWLQPRPVIKDNIKENIEFVRKTRQVMTFISKQDKVTQARFLQRLDSPFSGCEIGRVMIIRQIYEEIFFNESVNTFENHLKMKLYILKKTLIEELVCDDSPHTLSNYIYNLGKSCGLDGVEEAKDDFAYYSSFISWDKELEKFEKLLNEWLDDFCQGIAAEINNPNEDITAKYGEFIALRIKNNEIPPTFGFFDEDKKAMGLYDKLNEPSEDQEFLLQLYTSPTEVKQLLALLGYIRPLA